MASFAGSPPNFKFKFCRGFVLTAHNEAPELAAMAAMAAMADQELALFLSGNAGIGRDPPPQLPGHRENFENLVRLAAVACAVNSPGLAAAIHIHKKRQGSSGARRHQGLDATRIQRTAAVVLGVLSDSEGLLPTEKTIRELLGNNPDTSKALRL